MKSMVAAISALLAAATITVPAYAAQVKRGGVLTIGNPGEPVTLDPFLPTDAGSIFNVVQICETLVLADEPGTGLEPGLAESWTTSADGLSHIFKIREGVKFSNGKPLTVKDVVFSLEKAMAPSASFGFAFQPVKSVTPVDATHIRIELKTPYTPLLSALSIYSASIVEKSAYEASPQEFAARPLHRPLHGRELRAWKPAYPCPQSGLLAQGQERRGLALSRQGRDALHAGR